MAAIILSEIKNDAGACCHKFHGASCHNVTDCQCEFSLEWLARILYRLYLSLIITAASKQIFSLVFNDFFFANSYFFTFSNISGALHDKSCVFVFSNITSSVKNIRNHVGTAALPAARRTACQLQRLFPFIVSLEKYLATDLYSFTRPPCLELPGSIAYIGARFVPNEQNTTP